MEENIATVAGDRFPDKAERKAMVWRIWKNFLLGLFEAALVDAQHGHRIRSVIVPGINHMEHSCPDDAAHATGEDPGQGGASFRVPLS